MSIRYNVETIDHCSTIVCNYPLLLITACAPPPGTYNPEIANKNVGPVIYKTERFASNCGNGDSKQGSQFLYSSNESLSSLSDKGESTGNGYGPFKTVRL